jgi:anti-anti-sigma factor
VSDGGPHGPEVFRLTVEEDSATLVLRLHGDFDLLTMGRVEVALDAIRKLTRHVVFDLREVSFLDMAGLMTLMRANERARSEPFDVKVVPPAGLANRVFTHTRAGSELTMLAKPPSN